jgi:hypothetical protein
MEYKVHGFPLPSMNRTRAQRFALAIGAGLLGSLLQQYATGGLAVIWPGRIVTLPIAILLGPWFGVLASVIAVARATRRVALITICVVEAVTVGVAARRRYSPLIAGGIFWIANGLTFALRPSIYGAAYPASIIWPYALQTMVNGMVSLVLADFLATTLTVSVLRGLHLDSPRLRNYAFHAFVLASIVPVLVLSSAAGQILADRQEAEGREQLQHLAVSSGATIEGYIEEHRRVAENLAESMALAITDAQRLQLMKSAARIDPAIDHVTIVDATGRVTLTTSGAPANSPLIVQGVAGRDYFRSAVATRRPAVSDVLVSLIDGNATSVIAAPFFAGDGAASRASSSASRRSPGR